MLLIKEGVKLEAVCVRGSMDITFVEVLDPPSFDAHCGRVVHPLRRRPAETRRTVYRHERHGPIHNFLFLPTNGLRIPASLKLGGSRATCLGNGSTGGAEVKLRVEAFNCRSEKLQCFPFSHSDR